MKLFFASSLIYTIASLLWLYPMNQIIGWIGPAIAVWLLVAMAAFIVSGATLERLLDRWARWSDRRANLP